MGRFSSPRKCWKSIGYGVDLAEIFGGAFGGSILSQEWFDYFQTIDGPVLLYGCGVRSQDSLVMPNNINLFGVRGRFSESVLGVKSIGDPGILAPLAFGIDPNPDARMKFLFVPHKNDKTTYLPDGFEKINPLIPSYTNSELLVKQIANSDFILTGSLHVGIVSFALGVPFCFFRDEYLDIPIKFQDFADFYNIPILFASNTLIGIDFFLKNKHRWGTLQKYHFDQLLFPVFEFLSPLGIAISEKVESYLNSRETAFEKKSQALLNYKTI